MPIHVPLSLPHMLAVSTHDSKVFSWSPNDQPCNGFDDVLQRYRTIAPLVQLAGPTSFAPAIEAAVRIVEQSGGQFHVLLIIADGQVGPASEGPATEQAFVGAVALPIVWRAVSNRHCSCAAHSSSSAGCGVADGSL